MRGHPDRQPNLFVKINLEDLVPAEHPLRPIKRMADECLREMSRTFAAAYASASTGGRPSIPPERLLKAMILMSLYSVRSERALCERITFDMLFRWFLDMTPDEPCFDHSVFSVNRERFDRLDVTKKFSDRVVIKAFEAGLISEDHFSIDGTLLQSHASLKSLKQIERLKALEGEANGRDKDQDKQGPGGASADGRVGNGWADFRGEKRSNDTHRSLTDPEARLYTKTRGVAYLHHGVSVIMEKRHGIGLDIEIDQADGYAERRSAMRLIRRVTKTLGIKPATLGADKGYDAEDFPKALEAEGIEPHVACKSKKEIAVPAAEDEGAWARWFNQRRAAEPAFEVSQRKRKLNEKIFGWLKQFGGMRRARVVGRWKIRQLGYIMLGSLNLIRITRLLAT